VEVAELSKNIDQMFNTKKYAVNEILI